MSRSYKKTPISKDNTRSVKWWKRYAASKVRNIDIDSAKGDALVSNARSIYKKINEDTYDVHDYICYWSEEDATAYYESVVRGNIGRTSSWRERFLKQYPTLENYLQYWAKLMKRK